jgi:hypothetical protein
MFLDSESSQPVVVSATQTVTLNIPVSGKVKVGEKA